MVVCLLFVSSARLGAAGLQVGKVIGVTDGDTIEMLVGSTAEKIRLWGVDCPEHDQAFGSAAKKFTSQLAFGKTVKFQPMTQDRYGRTVANIYLLDGTYLNAEIVRAGYAWWFRRYAPEAKDIAQLESEARTNKRGLWRDLHPISPWDFRASQKNGSPVERIHSESQAERDSPVEIVYLHCNGTGQNEPDEYAEIQNKTDQVVRLEGWTLHDRGSNHQIRFPAGFRLPGKAKCRIYTNQRGGCLSFGVDGSAVWNNSGDTAYLEDQAGVLRAERECDD